jgi:tetratricopeptide (TPR) repeat protein
MTEHRRNLHYREAIKNKEEFRLIWLDANINDSTNSVLTQTVLLQLNPAAQFYTDSDRCIDLIKSIKDEQLLIIVSADFARLVLPQIRHLRSVVAIFIFGTNSQQYPSFKNEYEKMLEIYLDEDSLLKSISQTIHLLEKQRMAFSSFNQKQKSARELSKDSASFLWYRMLVYVLKQIPQDEQSKQDMLNKCRDFYQFNKRQLEKIEKFQNEYIREKAIEWYTDECFLYRLLNRALRTEDIELLYSFRFYIIDLCSEIEKESINLKNGGLLTLYRGQIMSVEEFEKLKNNVGKIISINSFFSTSRDIKVATVFAPSGVISNDVRAVLFEIRADPSLKTIVCADVSRIGRMADEEEILFNLNSLFKIISVDFDSTLHLWRIQLSTTNEGTENVEEYLTSIKQEMGDYSPIIYFGRLLLYELNQVDQAEKYFKMLLKSLPSDHSDIASVYNWIGVIHHTRKEFNLALENYQIAYEIRRERLPPDHPSIAQSLYDFGTVAETKTDYDQSINYYQQALDIYDSNYKNDHMRKAVTIKKIGMTYRKKGDINIALGYLFRALEMFQRILPAEHPYIAMCLRNIGEVHFNEGNFEKALDYFHRKLEIDEQSLPYDHSYLSGDLDCIVKTYKKKGETEKA